MMFKINLKIDIISKDRFHIANMPSADELKLPFYIVSFGKTNQEIKVRWRESANCFLVYSEKGCGRAFFEGVWHTVPEGSLIYFPTYTPIIYEPIDQNDWGTVYFTFSGKNAESTLGDKPFVLKDGRLKFIPSLMDRMVYPEGLLAPLEELYASYFYLITKVYGLSSGIIEKKSKSKPEDRIYKSIDYITQHFEEDLPVKRLAEMCGISEEYYCRTFKKLMGTTLVSYLNSMRVSRACDLLLQNPNERIEIIGKKCGFNSLAYFNRIFRREKGVSPTEFREKNL